ncbi:MAG: decaprenyl-phosphate phosphoribosyltransferase [Muribaculaceae bacterium]|nr:decaprenyl-phosphate phosphoribosyltransferase [Muribaculaceae bacterium]
MIKNIVLLLRPQQWVKNGFVFLPLFFNGQLFDADALLSTFMAFVAFCFAAAGIYCMNDIVDAEADRRHPKKCSRPIASGAISTALGWALAAICLATSFVSAFIVGDSWTNVAIVIGIYFVMNIAYCLRLKQIAIVDVFIISIGFVLRIFVGGFATGIFISHWIVLMTFLLALFLALAKRRDDVAIYEQTGVLPRKNVAAYNLDFMNQAIGIVAAITMVCYIMYTVSPDVVARFEGGGKYLYLTSIFVLAGIIRYLQITIVNLSSGSPTKVLIHNRFLQICLACWIVSFLIIIYI